jgi:SAM-dependent methyltransferase
MQAFCWEGWMSATDDSDPYLFGHSEHEARRLRIQAQLLNPSTQRMLVDAGIGPGMRVLDVGSGTGDVALLIAELVGAQGEVVGVDINPTMVETARRRAREAGLANVSFQTSDIDAVAMEGDFDAATGRCILFWVRDPVLVVRKVAACVRPGGSVAFQEPGNAMSRPVALYPSPLMDRMSSWLLDVFARSGLDWYMGLRLYPIFLDAGLPGPTMHLDAAVGGGPDWMGYEYMTSLIRTLLPRLVDSGVATEEEVDIDTLASRLQAEIVDQQGAAATWGFVSAWSRKPPLDG